MPENKLYGQAVVGNEPVTNAPDVGHIHGALVQFSADGKPAAVALQYAGPGGLCALRMDWLNAMFLLSLLKAMQLDSGTPFPDDPRRSSSR